jgi:thiamine biosynthesis protein ThiS
MLVTQPPREAVHGGVDAVQLRDKTASPLELIQMAKEARAAIGNSALLIVNAPVDLASECGAGGAQLSERHWRKEIAVAKSGACSIMIGASVHSIGAAIEAEALGADYLVAGTIYESKSHPETPGAGLKYLSDLCRSVKIPVTAIGGITQERVSECFSSGASAIAVLSPIMLATDPYASAFRYREAISVLLDKMETKSMIEVTINGGERKIDADQTVARYLLSLEKDPRMVVVEKNGDILPRERYAEELINEGDELEIVQMMAGG